MAVFQVQSTFCKRVRLSDGRTVDSGFEAGHVSRLRGERTVG
jgi:hypothetical protein